MNTLNMQQKKDLLTGVGQGGAKYCEAIEDDLYDSSEWSNRMPPSGWSFTKEHVSMLNGVQHETGRVRASYLTYFACHDGYDSHDSDNEYFNSMEEAVNAIWSREILDKAYDCFADLQNEARRNDDEDKGDKYEELLAGLLELYPLFRGAEKELYY